MLEKINKKNLKNIISEVFNEEKNKTRRIKAYIYFKNEEQFNEWLKQFNELIKEENNKIKSKLYKNENNI